MVVLRIMVFCIIVILFLASFPTKFTIVYSWLGPLGLFVLQHFYKKPNIFKALQFGIEISLAAFALYFAINLFIFHKVYSCPLVLIGGFVIYPIASGMLSAFFNIIPIGSNDMSKPEFKTLSDFRI